MLKSFMAGLQAEFLQVKAFASFDINQHLRNTLFSVDHYNSTLVLSSFRLSQILL